MTNSECVKEITKQVYHNTDDYEMKISKECYRKIVESLEENDKLKAEIEQLKAELEQSLKFKDYFMELYNQGLEVSNWHLNGDLEPLTNFIDSALEEAEQHLKGKVKE